MSTLEAARQFRARAQVIVPIVCALFAALIGPLIAACLLVDAPAVKAQEYTFPELVAFVVNVYFAGLLSAGLFGLVIGLAGGLLLVARARTVRTFYQLCLEAGLAGAVLGGLFPVVEWLGMHVRFSDRRAGVGLGALVGVCCAMLLTLILKRLLLALRPLPEEAQDDWTRVQQWP